MLGILQEHVGPLLCCFKVKQHDPDGNDDDDDDDPAGEAIFS